MKISILTLFPNYFSGVLQTSILARAQRAAAVEINVVNIRDFTTDKHQTTDDRPFGGGAGMVLKVEPIHEAVSALKKTDEKTLVVLTDARGQSFQQSHAVAWSKIDHLIIICGHYEGVDERVATYIADLQIRIGDYVLTGGEPAAAVITDAVARLLPNVLGNSDSLLGESHTEPGLLAPPQYTRPSEYLGWQVPAELLSGNHQQTATWRAKQAKTNSTATD